jgi:hypothetical protein
MRRRDEEMLDVVLVLQIHAHDADAAALARDMPSPVAA